MVGDVAPEPLALSYAFFVAVSLSVLACLGFAAIILYNRLLKTALMKQVFCLCLSDTLVYAWELAWCPSLVNLSPHCLDEDTCTLYYPMLRTLQMASVLWTTHIAVGVALVVSAKTQRPCRGVTMHAVPLIAVMLCSPEWIAGMTGGYQRGVVSGNFQLCTTTWSIHPDSIWTVEVFILLLIIIVAYIYTLQRIRRLSTAAAVSAKLYRVLIYVTVFCVCYAPYVVLQGAGGSVELAKLAKDSLVYQIVYLLYLLTGFCNVAAYGIHNWDGAWWRRRRRRGSTGNEGRVVTFLSSRTPMEFTPSVSNVSNEDLRCSDMISSEPQLTAIGLEGLGGTEVLADTLAMSLGDEIGHRLEHVDDPRASLTNEVVTAARAYGCI